MFLEYSNISELNKIQTKRLVLRPFTTDDIKSSYEMNLDEEVSRYTRDGGKVSYEEIERRIKEDVLVDYRKHGFGRLVVGIKDGPSFIGFCGLKYLEDMNEVDLGYRFMSQYWGNGYATEAARACIEFGFQTLELNKIVAMVVKENFASIRVLEKSGMSYKKDIIEEGEWVRLYSILSPS